MQLDPTVCYYQGCARIIEGTESQKKAELEKLEKTGKFFVQPKCDGNWAAVHGGKTLSVISRNVKPIKNHELPSFPAGCLVVGEIAHGSQEAVKRRKQIGHAFIDVFDILFFNHNWLGDKPLRERLQLLQMWHGKLWKSAQDYYRLMPVWINSFVRHYEDEVEGVIVKPLDDGVYHPNTKSMDWIKVKKVYDYDMVVMGFELSDAATKTAQPMVKNVTVGQYVNGVLTPMTKVMGFDNALSADIAQNFQKYRGKVMVVEGYCRFDSGSVRHPFFNRFRDDKDPKDCVWS